MARTVVVLPMPLRPISASISPSPMLKPTPNSTCALPYPASSPATVSMRRPDRRRAPPGRRGSATGVPEAMIDAGDQHGDLVRQREHRLRIMLDQQQAEPRLQPLQQRDDLAAPRRAPSRPAAHPAGCSAARAPGPRRARARGVRRARGPAPASAPGWPSRPCPDTGSTRRCPARPTGRSGWRCRACTASATFSAAVKLGTSWLIWNVRARPSRARACGLSRVMSRSPSSTWPESGLSMPIS